MNYDDDIWEGPFQKKESGITKMIFHKNKLIV